jgi:hypothetical protein
VAVLWFNVGVSAADLALMGTGAGSIYLAPETQITAPQLVVACLALLVLLGLVSIPFWILRSSNNAHVFKPQMRFSVFGALWWYVIPLANLLLPFRAMAEIWDVSDLRGTRRSDPILNWWWATWLIGGPIFLIASAAAGPAGQNDPDAARWWVVMSDAVSIALSLLFMVIVRRITRMQLAKYALLNDKPGVSAAVELP